LDFRRIARVAGPLVFVLVQLLPLPADPGGPAKAGLGLLLWMAVWWVGQAVPYAATSLLPLVVLPLFGLQPMKAVAGRYFHPLIVLMLGGFLMAAALERWNLHRRASLAVLAAVGRSRRAMLFAFMGTSAFFSMWISNTATTLMLLPIATATIRSYEQRIGSEQQDFRRTIMLGLAWAASIGGMATLIGTPPNLLLLDRPGIDERLSFASWLAIGVPTSLVLLVIAGLYLSMGLSGGGKRNFGPERAHLLASLRAMGPMDAGAKRTLAVTCSAALAWVTRPLWMDLFLPLVERGAGAEVAKIKAYVGDPLIAMVAAMLLLSLPGGRDPEGDGSDRLLSWNRAESIPWGVLLLLGGGFALAGAVESSGLAAWIGAGAGQLSTLPLPLMVLLICLGMTFLTEVTMNTAVTALMLPILEAAATEVGHDPLLWMLPATLSASCAFMMPSATAPNAIVFRSGWLTIPDMARRGLALNFIGAVVITIAVLVLAPTT